MRDGIDTLRRAAALMRERANAVGEGPWESYPLPDAGPNRWTMTGVGVAGDDMGHRTETMFCSDAEHIASWHPVVALAVADWLDQTATDAPFLTAQVKYAARAVANAYLEEAAP